MEKENTLSSADKIKRIFTHEPKTVLVRLKGIVRELSVKNFLQSAEQPVVRNLADCCLFSVLSYAPDSRTIEIKEEGSKVPVEKRIELPKSWEEITNLPDIVTDYRNETGRKTYNGLSYRVFKNINSKTIIVAFRGSTSEKGDWLSNARWVTRINPFHDDHYDVIQDKIDSLLEAACKEIDANNNDEIRVIATGHSLGGGLATMAAYASDKINEVVAINSSPITGFYGVPVGERSRNKKDLLIARIFEHGEVLAYLRLPLRLFYPLSKEHPTILEARFNFGIRKSTITEHSLPSFANAIWNAANGSSIYS